MKLTVLKSNVTINEVLVDTPDVTERYEIYVGRADDCHVQIDDPLISRHHFILKNDQNGWQCEKLSNLGVILINGNSLSKARLNGGDEIKFGSYSLLVTEMQTKPKEPSIQNIQSIITATVKPAAKPSEIKTNLKEVLEDAFEDSPIEENDELSFETSESKPTDHSGMSLDSLSDEGLDANVGLAEVDTDNLFGNSKETTEEIVNSDPVSFGETEAPGFDAGSTQQDEGTRFLRAFLNYQLVLFGEFAPYDRYQMDQDEVFIGRDPKKCQIILNDPEVSSVHAVIRKKSNDITLEDLGSSNGTILNGERINKAHVATGDEFVIGSTTFTLEVKSDLLDAESDRLMPVESGQVIETEEIHEEEVSHDEDDLNFAAEAPTDKSLVGKAKAIWKNPAQRKKLLIYAVLLCGVWMFLGESEPEKVEAPKEDKIATPAPDSKAAKKVALSKDLETRRNVAYELGVSFFEQNKYAEALREFQTVVEIDAEYKKAQTYLEQTKLGLKRLEELETQKRAEEERIKTKKLIEEILVKAREAVKERQAPLAENYFSQITEKDPENIEVQQLKMELEAWQKNEEKIALEKAAKEAHRKAMVDALTPGKTYYLKKEWYRSVLKLEEFLRRKGTDEDLVKEASEMLSESRTQLASDLGPLLGKARSFKEGQDYKNAYEAFLEILKVEPTNAEALNEVDEIKTQLEARSKRIYREAIIAESLSLFSDAKEKFQEVQQISPTDSEYYRKATEKLKNYLE